LPPALLRRPPHHPLLRRPGQREIVAALRAKGVEVELLVLPYHDRAETALALGDEKCKLFQAVLPMIEARQ